MAAKPKAKFEATPRKGRLPLSVQFNDASENEPLTWAWNFGDGASSTERNPAHVYALAGDYAPTLTVTNAKGSDSKTTNASYITVRAARVKAEKVKIRSFLKAHGHKSEDVDALPLDTESQRKASLRAVHKITEQQYKDAGGTA
jgi:PKD repeat protein